MISNYVFSTTKELLALLDIKKNDSVSKNPVSKNPSVIKTITVVDEVFEIRNQSEIGKGAFKVTYGVNLKGSQLSIPFLSPYDSPEEMKKNELVMMYKADESKGYALSFQHAASPLKGEDLEVDQKAYNFEVDIHEYLTEQEMNRSHLSIGHKVIITFMDDSIRMGILTKEIKGLRLDDYCFKMTDKMKRKIMMDVAKGIIALHKAGVAHRDITAKNILVKLSKKKFNPIKAYLIDLGTSVFCDRRKKNPSRFNFKIFPDEFFHNHHCNSEKIDAYQFGILLYQIFSPAKNKEKAKPFNEMMIKIKEILGKSEDQVDDLSRNKYGFLTERGACESWPGYEEIHHDVKCLIKNLTHSDPEERMSVEDALPILKGIKFPKENFKE